MNATAAETFGHDALDVPVIENTIQLPEAEIALKPSDCEKYIATANNKTQEIFSSYQKKNNSGSSSADRITLQNKFTNKFFNSKYNKLNTLKSHKLSTYLSYEICTRAP